MAGEWSVVLLEKAPLQIIDGDRGKHYPNQSEFSSAGDCLFLNAGNVTTAGFRFSDCAFITADKDALLRKGKLVRNDVVLTTRGTVGNVAYFDESVPFDHIRINSGMVVLRAHTPALQPRYLYLFLRSTLFHAQVSALRTGSAQPQLPIQDINRITIPIPPPVEQRAIAHIIGTLDDRIELSRHMSETLEAVAQALFTSWFVDFDLVRAKAEGRKADRPERLADRFPDFFEESELGEIPKGWTVGSFGDVVTQRTARAGSRDVIVLSAVSSGKLLRSDDQFTKRVYSKDKDKYLIVEKWDIAYNPSRINIGSIGVLEESILGGVSPVYVVARPKPAYRSFLAFAIRRARTKEWIKSLASGSVRQSLSYADFASIPCVIPPEPLAQEFNARWSALRDRIHAHETVSRTLATLRDTLLPRLISGELRLEDPSRFLGGEAR